MGAACKSMVHPARPEGCEAVGAVAAWVSEVVSSVVKEMASSWEGSSRFSFWNSRMFSTPSTVTMPHRKMMKIRSSATRAPRFFGGSVGPV